MDKAQGTIVFLSIVIVDVFSVFILCCDGLLSIVIVDVFYVYPMS